MLLMSLSSKVFPGLRTAKAGFAAGAEPGDSSVAGCFRVEQIEERLVGDGWREEDILAEASGWWGGHYTGATACKVSYVAPVVD